MMEYLSAVTLTHMVLEQIKRVSLFYANNW